MSETTAGKQNFYFSTRDLLIMAVLSALGGVTSTYVNALSDTVHAILGFPGASQWAAGLHVIWIVLAMGIVRKTGTGTATGILKGTVELMSGNSHGVIILLVNLVAGLLVDFGFLIIQNKRSIAAFLLAGGLAAGSNVLVFQLFATLPSNILAMGAILFLTLVAAISGVIFSGFIPFYLIRSLIKANVVKMPLDANSGKKTGWSILSGVLILAILLTIYLQTSLKGTPTIQIAGAVDHPYDFPSEDSAPEKVSRQMFYRGVNTEYTGYSLLELVEFSQPQPSADTLLIEASDGYAFLISFDELRTNQNILLVEQGRGKELSYDVVGPTSSKAWVRNVVSLTISASQGLQILMPEGEIQTFTPDDWLEEMDSTQVSLPTGAQKLQGVALWKIITAFTAPDSQLTITVKSEDGSVSYPWHEVNEDDNLRIFTAIGEDGYQYALAEMSGEVQLFPLSSIEVK